jgi:chromosome segregation ATPase
VTRRALQLGLVGLLLAGPLWASELESRERAVRDAHARRQQLLAEHAGLTERALSLAETIDRAKQRASGPRADPELESLLRAFETLADQLDRLEREMAEAKDRVGEAAQRFEEAAERHLEGLRDRHLAPEEMARALAEIEAARARVAELVEPPAAFRPALEVRAEDADGPEELELKGEILRAERARLEGERRRLEAEDILLAARLDAKRRLQRELEAAQRDARLDLRLIRTQAQRVRQAAEDLRRHRRNNEDQRRQLGSALEEIEKRLAEIEGRLAGLLRRPSSNQ